MILDRPTLARLRKQAAQARKVGHYARAAQLERQAVELAGTLGLAGERTRALLWEGYSLRLAGEDDLALAVLLQAINEPAPTADPADRFSALTTILHLSLERKSARFCRALLEQGRRDLAESRQPWSALLDFLEGELAFRRGDFAAAWDWHERAWAGRRDSHPRLTPTTHRWALCRTAFRRREPVELERFTHQWREWRPNSTLEQQLVMRARWLGWRARRTTAASEVTADSAPIEEARAFLTGVAEARAPREFGARLEALRVLALAGDWDRIDAHLRHKPLPPDTFETALGLGDLALGRARVALGLPVVDDDYGETAVGAALAAPDSTRAAAALSEAETCYRDALGLAEDQDQRLETGWYGATVRQRLALLGLLRPLVVAPDML
ncbi:MAG: hypothetical protein U5O69_09260 [Candidatus Competibacteraceae bacterium]|nr:hypothetical protein [Candidatus Competibacteraceae bacterium]